MWNLGDIMDKININDINFNKIKMINTEATQSIIYRDIKYYYKIFKYYNHRDSLMLNYLFRELDGINIEGLLLPKYLITDNNNICGYITDNVGAKSLDMIYTENKNLDCKKFFEIMKKASILLKKLHEEKIVVCDFNISNILVDKKHNIYLCDIESFKYKGVTSDYVSKLLFLFTYEYRNEMIDINENSDRLSLLLEFLQVIYILATYEINNDYYDYYTYINTLNNIKPIFKDIMNQEKDIGEIPYLDELITLDNYKINRKKQLEIIGNLYK